MLRREGRKVAVVAMVAVVAVVVVGIGYRVSVGAENGFEEVGQEEVVGLLEGKTCT